MKVSPESRLSICEFLGKEAIALDERDWDAWLGLYAEDCEYWLPAWKTDGQLVENPKTDLSLIYYPNRVGLEARVFRIRTGRAASAQILPRTVHMFTPTAMEQTAQGIKVRTHWTTNSVYESRIATYFGHAHYLLEETSSDWLIRSKKTVLLNDKIHEVLDFYNV